MNKAVASWFFVEYLKGDYDTLIYGSTPKALTLVSRKFRKYGSVTTTEGSKVLVSANS